MSRYLTEMADVIRAAGVPVVEQEGWQTRARSSGGYADGRPWCVMWHHTASAPGADPASDAAYMSYNADAAPIANILLARDGTAWILAAGATNTNGSGNAMTFSRGTVPADSMNTYAIGMEIQNSGVGEPYPAVQMDNAFAVSLALCAAYGLTPDDICTHSVYAPSRKIDPATADAVQGSWRPASVNSSGSWSLDDLADECYNRFTTAPVPVPPLEDDEEMAFLIRDVESGSVALVYGDGKVTHIDGTALDGMIARFGPWIDMEPGTYNDFDASGT